MKTRTELVAEAIKQHLQREEGAEATVTDAREYGRDLGFWVGWEGGFDWTLDYEFRERFASHVAWFDCWLEPVDGSVLGVYPMDSLVEEEMNDLKIKNLIELWRQQTS